MSVRCASGSSRWETTCSCAASMTSITRCSTRLQRATRARPPPPCARTSTHSAATSCGRSEHRIIGEERTMLRTGEEHLKSIRDGRVVYIGDERVDDVTRHPAFRNAAQTVAALYDMKYDPANRALMSYEEDGGRHSIYFLRARSRDDLQRRMLGHRRIADFTYGMFGRSPDHVASFITGMAMKSDALKPPCGWPGNLLAYYRYARDHDLS